MSGDFVCKKCGQGFFDQDGAAACARAGCQKPPAPAEIVPAKVTAPDPTPSPDAAAAAPVPSPDVEAAELARRVLAGERAKPTLGRIVLYRPRVGECHQFAAMEADQYPAIVTRVWSPETVNLHVVPDGMNPWWVTSAPYGIDPGCWSWPPRV